MLATCVWIWAGAALLLFPHWSSLARIGALLVLLVATMSGIRMAPPPWRVVIAWIGPVLVVGLWSTQKPSHTRVWASGHERSPAVTFAGDTVIIDPVRHALWRTAADVDFHWETRRYDLTTIRSVDLVVEPFEDWRGPAHLFVTFGFAQGEHVAISIEARREAGEAYSLLRGAFRNFELLYVVGDERDLIGMRANIRKDPVYVFPMRATPEEARSLFVSMLTRADTLSRHPEFYHSLVATCATNLLTHVNQQRRTPINAFDWRIALPGYADELAWDLGLIDFDGTLEDARARFLINERSGWDADLDGPRWSAKIRTPARSSITETGHTTQP